MAILCQEAGLPELQKRRLGRLKGIYEGSFEGIYRGPLKGSISIGGPLKGSKMAPLKDLRGLLGRDL